MKATIIALEGDLGSGKTYFAQKFGEVAGVKETMTSPTFSLMNFYKIDWCGFKKLIHIDAYRLEKDTELETLGWQEIIDNPENIVLLEWPERVERLLPSDTKRLLFKHEK